MQARDHLFAIGSYEKVEVSHWSFFSKKPDKLTYTDLLACLQGETPNIPGLEKLETEKNIMTFADYESAKAYATIKSEPRKIRKNTHFKVFSPVIEISIFDNIELKASDQSILKSDGTKLEFRATKIHIQDVRMVHSYWYKTGLCHAPSEVSVSNIPRNEEKQNKRMP